MLLIVFFIHQVSLGATVRLGSGTIRTTQIVRPVTFSISKMRYVKNSPIYILLSRKKRKKIMIIIIIIIIIIINCGLWDLLDVKSEAGLLLAIMSFRPQTYATKPQGLVDSSKSLNIWSLLHGIEPHKHLPLSFYDKKLGFITEFGIF